jgi:hypothetical protein
MKSLLLSDVFVTDRRRRKKYLKQEYSAPGRAWVEAVWRMAGLGKLAGAKAPVPA